MERYCPLCSFRVDDFNFCPVCGHNMQTMQASSGSDAHPHKNPWVAAILNFIFLGAGYLYLGRRVFLGVGLLMVFIVSLIAGMSIGEAELNYLWKNNHTFLLLMLMSDGLLSLALAIDAYFMAVTDKDTG